MATVLAFGMGNVAPPTAAVPVDGAPTTATPAARVVHFTEPPPSAEYGTVLAPVTLTDEELLADILGIEPGTLRAGRYDDLSTWGELSFNQLLHERLAEEVIDELLRRASWNMTDEGLLDADGVGLLDTGSTADVNPPSTPTPAGVDVGPAGIVTPISGARLVDSFGFPRSGGRSHRGIDIFAPAGTPIRAVIGGVVIRVRGPGARPEGRLGGRTVTIRGNDGRFYYYAHNSRNLVDEGMVVATGEPIALVGRSGNAVTTPPHLHLGISVGGGSFSESRAVNPFPLLEAATEGRSLPSVEVVTRSQPPTTSPTVTIPDTTTAVPDSIDGSTTSTDQSVVPVDSSTSANPPTTALENPPTTAPEPNPPGDELDRNARDPDTTTTRPEPPSS